MNFAAIALTVGALIQFFGGSLLYVLDTLKGKSKPNRMTFLIWTAGPFVGVAAGAAAGVTWWVLLPVFMAGFGPLAILLSSFKNPGAYWKLGVLDYTCGTFAVLALFLWVITSDPLIAILFSIIADALAAFPTIIKSWKYPETETGLNYFIALCNVGLGLLVAPSHSFAQIGFLVYLFVCDVILTVAIYRVRFLKKFQKV